MYGMRCSLVFLSWLLLTWSSLKGQANMVVCEAQPILTGFCWNSCLLCNLDGLQGVTGGVEVSAVIPSCLGGVYDTYGFVALSEALTIEIDAGDCSNDQGGSGVVGLRVTVYTAEPECDILHTERYESVISCSNSVGNPATANEFITENTSKGYTLNSLTIGRIYYVGIGSAADGSTCPYTVSVTEGNTELSLKPLAIDNLDTNICQGSVETYAIQDTVPLTQYTFLLDGDTVSSAANAQITYDQPGVYELCVTASNPCSQATPTCYTITVTPPHHHKYDFIPLPRRMPRHPRHHPLQTPAPTPSPSPTATVAIVSSTSRSSSSSPMLLSWRPRSVAAIPYGT